MADTNTTILDAIAADPNVSDAFKDGVRGEAANAAYCTVVFQCDLKRFEGNPFKTETLFGRPVAVGIGDALAGNDDRHELLEALRLMLNRFDFGEKFPDDHPISAARAAVAKATGAQK